MFQRLLHALLGKPAEEPPRQTTFGTSPPFPSALTHEELVSNLQYIESELKNNGIRHTYYESVNLWDYTLHWYETYIRAAKTVLSDDAASALSEAALSLLPHLNPYADRLYDTDNLKDLKDLATAADDVLVPATIRLGDAIVKADPDVRDEDGILDGRTSPVKTQRSPSYLLLLLPLSDRPAGVPMTTLATTPLTDVNVWTNAFYLSNAFYMSWLPMPLLCTPSYVPIYVLRGVLRRLDMFQRLLHALLGKPAEEPLRQTTFGTSPPFPSALTHGELVSNLEYIESELKNNGIRHTYRRVNLWDYTLHWYEAYIGAAKTVLSDNTASALSEAALSLLPHLNPYADRLYDTKNMKDLKDLATATDDVLVPAAIRLGDAIVKADPDARDERGVLVRVTLQDLKDSD